MAEYYSKVKKLGEGGFGKVFLVLDKVHRSGTSLIAIATDNLSPMNAPCSVITSNG